MNDISYNNLKTMSDMALAGMLGRFIRQARIRQNKTQALLAQEAGIARSTLSLLEKGEASSLTVFIQLLRALGMLDLLEEFRVREQYSPLQLAKMQHSQPQRVKPEKGNKGK